MQVLGHVVDLLFCHLRCFSIHFRADIPDPPQCEQLLDGTWAEQGEGDQNVPVEPALEATEYTVSAMEAENCPVSVRRDKSNPEGSVTIEMSAQPLLELTPMTGSSVIASHRSHTPSQCITKWDLVSVSQCVGVSDT